MLYSSVPIIGISIRNFSVLVLLFGHFADVYKRQLYKYDAEKDAEKNKVMKINEQWEELKERSHANIQSERDRKSTRLNSSHSRASRMPSSA